MKWLRICALLLAVLVSMRLGSWAIEWVLAKITPLSAKRAAVVANLAGLGVFAGLLYRDLMPGEPMDPAALLFGLAVFAAYCASDFFWRPWKTRQPDAGLTSGKAARSKPGLGRRRTG